MKKIILLYAVIVCILNSALASGYNKPDFYPSNWWVGMKNPKLQLMLHTVNIGDDNIKVIYPGVTLVSINRPENKNYVFLNLVIAAGTKPGTMKIYFKGEEGEGGYVGYELRQRRKGNGNVYAQGVTSADLIYLIMPDRFSNGDPSNDRIALMNDTASDRANPFLRHGGDLQGIENHLDYFNDLGATALWLTPVVENDQALTDEGGTMRSAYHGYAFTNQYQIDRRLGGNPAYKKMIDAAHAHGLKIIQDAVYNHVGNKHFLFLDQPSKDWFNQWPAYTNTTYKDQPLVDPHASKSDYAVAVNGWFTPFLPDLNQRNPYVANFLIQHALWTVEEFGIDGWRVDTYFYSDRDFLNKINEALYQEFPHISIFGETTMQSVTEQAYYMQNNISTGWKSNLQGVTDYEWSFKALAAFKEKPGDGSGIGKLYNILVQDILYKDPMRNEIFFDNHDQDRFFSVIGENMDNYKMGIALLLTQRGIPQLYYGTEILMKNRKDPSDAEVRRDFPGGWKDDSANKFNASGRTSTENEAYDYTRTLALFRKKSSAIKTGRLMQYLPQGGLYVYFRYDDRQTVMCVMNTGDEEKKIDFSAYAERVKGFNNAVNVIDGERLGLSQQAVIPAKKMWVMELK